MKKIYHEDKWKKYSIRRSRRVLNRKRVSIIRRGIGPRGHSKYVTPLIYSNVKVTKFQTEMALPSNFSIINNPEEVLAFFHDVDFFVKDKRNIWFSMKGINNITEDAILYMLSQLDYHRSNSRNYKISGDCPDDAVAQSIFLNSGFYDYVKSKLSKSTSRDPNVLTIKKGNNVNPVVAGEVANFARVNLSRMDKKDSKSIYSTMIECMANTNNHAYNNKDGKWWLMARYDQSNKKVRFAFLDNGLTIPSTIKKNLKDYVLNIAGTILPTAKVRDCNLIESALKGEFRSKTGYPFRGKGLPKIYEYSNSGRIDNLAVISRYGVVNAPKIRTSDMENRFRGTLLSWDFI